LAWLHEVKLDGWKLQGLPRQDPHQNPARPTTAIGTGDQVNSYKKPGVLDRRKSAEAAKREQLANFKAGSADPARVARHERHVAVSADRSARHAARDAAAEAKRQELAAEAARAAEIAAEAQRVLDHQRAEAEAEAAQHQAETLAEQKAARDARYAARKAAKKQRRKG
jgi:hypothetical protein